MKSGTIELGEPYAPRPIRDLGLWTLQDFRMKAYGIAYRRASPRPGLVAAARAVAARCLAEHAGGGNHYGVGYVGVHDGRGAAFVFVDWWVDENELHHHVFVAPAETPEMLAERTASGLSACVWGLAVIAHERQAWLDTVLCGKPGPDVDAYLLRRLDAEV